MSEWRLGQPVDGPRSVWRRPAQVGLLGALALAIVRLFEGFPEGDSITRPNEVIWVLLDRALVGFLVGFFVAIVLLTYLRVSERPG